MCTLTLLAEKLPTELDPPNCSNGLENKLFRLQSMHLELILQYCKQSNPKQPQIYACCRTK